MKKNLDNLSEEFDDNSTKRDGGPGDSRASPGSPEFLKLERMADQAGFLHIDEPVNKAGTEGKSAAFRKENSIPESVVTLHVDSDTVTEPITDWTGRVIGPYTLVRLIGNGGGGVVYEATQQVPIKRKVAIKFFKDRHFGDRSRLKIEIDALARFDHPGLVSIIDVGGIDNDHPHNSHPYVVMKLVEGERIDTWVEKYNAVPLRIAELMLAVAKAMEYVHRKNVLHRDLKPSNILVTPAGRPVVTDFGLAKYFETGCEHSLTDTGTMVGTLGFLAPETARSPNRDASPTVDVYGIGATMYRLLTGLTPARSENWSVCFDDLKNREPTPLRKFNPQVPRDLESICLKCLEKSPDLRYSSMTFVADDLQRYLAGLPVVARPIGRAKRFARWCRREPVIASLVGIFVVSVLTAAVAFAVLWQSSEDSNRRMKKNLGLALTILRQEQEDAERHLAVVPGSLDYRLRRLDTAIGFLKTLVADNPDDLYILRRLAVAHYLRGQVPILIGRDDARRKDFETALALFERLADLDPDDHSLRFDVFHSLLALGSVEGNFSPELRQIHHLQALEIIDQLVVEFPNEPDYRDALACQLQMVSGIYYDVNVDLDLAKQLAGRCVEVATSLAAEYPDRPSYLKHIISGSRALAMNSACRGEFEEAQSIIESVIPVANELSTRQPEIPENREMQAIVLASAGWMAIRNGDLLLAEGYQQQATRIIEQLVAEYPDNDVFIATKSNIHRSYQNYLAGIFPDQ